MNRFSQHKGTECSTGAQKLNSEASWSHLTVALLASRKCYWQWCSRASCLASVVLRHVKAPAVELSGGRGIRMGTRTCLWQIQLLAMNLRQSPPCDSALGSGGFLLPVAFDLASCCGSMKATFPLSAARPQAGRCSSTGGRCWPLYAAASGQPRGDFGPPGVWPSQVSKLQLYRFTVPGVQLHEGGPQHGQ